MTYSVNLLPDHTLDLVKHACINGTHDINDETSILYDLLEGALAQGDPETLNRVLETLEEKLTKGQFQDDKKTPFSTRQTLVDVHRLKAQIGGGKMILASLIDEAIPSGDTLIANEQRLANTIDPDQNTGTRRVLATTEGEPVDPHFLIHQTLDGKTHVSVVEREPTDNLQPVHVRISFKSLADALHAMKEPAFGMATLWLLAEELTNDQALPLVEHLELPEPYEAHREANDETMSDYSDYLVHQFNGKKERATYPSIISV